MAEIVLLKKLNQGASRKKVFVRSWKTGTPTFKGAQHAPAIGKVHQQFIK